MHFEILVEDSSGTKLLAHLMPKFVGPYDSPHRWTLRSYGGIGHIPKNLANDRFPGNRGLLANLPKLLQGYARTPGYESVIVVCDSDRRDCKTFLRELRRVATEAKAEAITMFRLAIEETEAWYLGDHQALLTAFPNAKKRLLNKYKQDSICRTWERLADIVHPGGSAAVVHPGNLKHEWANRIGPLMDPDRNCSPSFGKLRDGLRRLATQAS